MQMETYRDLCMTALIVPWQYLAFRTQTYKGITKWEKPFE
jgi:hypothetical protein